MTEIGNLFAESACGRQQASLCLAAGVRRGRVGSDPRYCLPRQGAAQQQECHQVSLQVWDLHQLAYPFGKVPVVPTI